MRFVSKMYCEVMEGLSGSSTPEDALMKDRLRVKYANLENERVRTPLVYGVRCVVNCSFVVPFFMSYAVLAIPVVYTAVTGFLLLLQLCTLRVALTSAGELKSELAACSKVSALKPAVQDTSQSTALSSAVPSIGGHRPAAVAPAP
jgi:hypothetical protein